MMKPESTAHLQKPHLAMLKLEKLLEDYGQSHKNSTNRLIHKVCVPAILFSLLGLLKSIPSPVDISFVFISLCLLYYSQFRNPKLFLSLAIMVVPMVVILEAMRPHLFWPSLIIFVVAWIGQFIGHKIEGAKPSFFKDLFFLLIGPLWVLRSMKWL